MNRDTLVSCDKLEVILEDDPDEARDFRDYKDWCVDLGPTLAPMNEVELCDAIDRGEVTHAMRVWRAGLEGWTPVEDLPELAPVLGAASSRRPGD